MRKMAAGFKQAVDNLKLKKKMTFVWLFSATVILGVALWGDYRMIRSYNDTLYAVMVDSMNYALTGISRQLDNYETLSETLFRSSQIQEKLTQMLEQQRLYTADYEKLRKLLLTESSQYDYINYLILIDETTGNVFGDTAKAVLSEENKARIIAAAEEEQGRPVWITEYGKDSQMILTRKIMRIENLGKDTLGTLILNIDIAALIRDTGVSEQENFRCVLVDLEGNPLSDSGEYTNEQIRGIYEELKGEKFSVVNLDGHRYFAVYREESSGKWGYVYFSDYDQMYASIHENIRSIAQIGVLCFLFIVVLNSIFTNDTLKRFGGLIQKNYETELRRKRAEVEMLETQINPHFLYNTLQTINWRAKALHSTEISKMVESLSQILQMTLSNRKSCITVEEELDLAQQYVTIQQMRMEGELIYEVFVEPELLTAMIPKLVIQPLVENGIHHSMDAMQEVMRISVDVRREGEEIAVFVRNSGSRFPEDLLAKLRREEIRPTGHGIGILNIDTRIKLTYGDAYGIAFYNEEGFAIAKLRIPFETEGKTDV
ncbi:MAG: histidine kinase [Eubacteriales bacterium]|nr:histidine kinase [Eubacteriales bacterium]